MVIILGLALAIRHRVPAIYQGVGAALSTRGDLADLTNRKETLLRPHCAQTLLAEGFAMAPS